MSEPIDFPFPNPYELLRYIVRAMDIKNSNKRLDERVFERVYDTRELNQEIADFYAKVEDYMGVEARELLAVVCDDELANYMQFSSQTHASGVTREQMFSILSRCPLVYFICKLAKGVEKQFGGPSASTLFSSETNAVPTVLHWLEKHIDGWEAYITTLTKEDRDMISAWKRCDYLPSAQSIRLLPQKGTNSLTDKEWLQVKTLLFWSRCIDWMRKSDLLLPAFELIRVQLWGAPVEDRVNQEIKECQLKVQQRMEPLIPAIGFIQHGLMRTASKQEPERYREALNYLRVHLPNSAVYQHSKYWTDWHEARFHVFSGDLETASEWYKLAFEDCLFRAGSDQKKIIDEALVVASSLKSVDKVFLKRLKWSLINFGYDIPSVSSTDASNKVSDTIESWEIKMWKQSFNSVFPASGLFPGVTMETKEHLGPLMFTDISKIKPDFRHPNRKIKVGETKQKVIPQLVWFLQCEEYEICKRLLEAGADVNVWSESDETPLMMSLEPLRLMDVIPKSMNDKLFWLVSKYPHASNTVNKRTQKKRLLPICSGVESGRLDVVERLLEMGADPNGRGDTDEQTPLNLCLKLIGLLKNPRLATQHQASMPMNEYALDSIRRYSAGSTGMSLDLPSRIETPQFKRIEKILMEMMNEQFEEFADLDSLRQIATTLIRAGADVNARHKSPVDGYTPLMLAAELDEVELFNQMLIHNGNPELFYLHHYDRRRVNCFEIAESFGAKNVLEILAQVRS